MRKIVENNKYAETNNISFRMGVNLLADLDDSEFIKTYGGYVPLRNQSLVKSNKISQREMLRIARLSRPPSRSNHILRFLKRNRIF